MEKGTKEEIEHDNEKDNGKSINIKIPCYMHAVNLVEGISNFSYFIALWTLNY